MSRACRARPCRIKNSRSNDRYFSTGRNDDIVRWNTSERETQERRDRRKITQRPTSERVRTGKKIREMWTDYVTRSRECGSIYICVFLRYYHYIDRFRSRLLSVRVSANTREDFAQRTFLRENSFIMGPRPFFRSP